MWAPRHGDWTVKKVPFKKGVWVPTGYNLLRESGSGKHRGRGAGGPGATQAPVSGTSITNSVLSCGSITKVRRACGVVGWERPKPSKAKAAGQSGTVRGRGPLFISCRPRQGSEVEFREGRGIDGAGRGRRALELTFGRWRSNGRCGRGRAEPDRLHEWAEMES